MAAALTVRMEMLVAPAGPCPRQPDRVDAEGQRREQPSQLEPGACSRARTDLIQKSASWAISARRWKTKIVGLGREKTMRSRASGVMRLPRGR